MCPCSPQLVAQEFLQGDKSTFILCSRNKFQIIICLQVWNPGIVFNVTSVLASGHSDVSLFTPACCPGISDGPVSFVNIITNVDNSMIVRASGAGSIIKNIAVVTLEVTVGIDIDSMGSIIVNTFSKSIDAFTFDIHKVISRDADNRGERFAAISIVSSIWAITSLVNDSVKGTISPSTVTVSSSTVNQHLF